MAGLSKNSIANKPFRISRGGFTLSAIMDKKPKQKSAINWVEGLTLLVAVAGLFAVFWQLYQANKHKKWDNYNAMNAAYHALYDEVYNGSYDDLLKSYTHISRLDSKQLAWIRAYFDLYAEEYWLHEQKLIPAEMLFKQIDGGVNLNFREHPVMMDGYEFWRDKGAFQHPTQFIPFVDAKIACIRENQEFQNSDPCNPTNRTN